MSEDKPAKERKIPVEARGGIVMASHTITSLKDSGSKDSPVVSNAPGTSGLLNIKDPMSNIQFERAHRIGARKPDKIRPIVAKFVLSEHKDVVKAAASKFNLKAPPYDGAYRVTDQLPPEVLERRKELIPRLISERAKGNKASLVRDKLYVNGKFVD